MVAFAIASTWLKAKLFVNNMADNNRSAKVCCQEYCRQSDACYKAGVLSAWTSRRVVKLQHIFALLPCLRKHTQVRCSLG
jgi:hypothetical protein